MGRIAQPREVAELKGAVKHDPQRYRKEVPKSDSALGQPPEKMKPTAKAIWFEIETYALPGVLTGSDRFIMEVLCNLLAEYRKSPVSFKATSMANLIKCLARLGLSPGDRQKFGVEKTDKENEFGMF